MDQDGKIWFTLEMYELGKVQIKLEISMLPLIKNYNHVIKFRKFHYEISAWNRTLWKDSKLANTWLKNFLWYSWWSLFSEKSSMKNHFRLKRMNEDKNGGHFLDYRIWKGPLMESWNYITRFISTYHLQMRMPSCRSRE